MGLVVGKWQPIEEYDKGVRARVVLKTACGMDLSPCSFQPKNDYFAQDCWLWFNKDYDFDFVKDPVMFFVLPDLGE